MIASSKGTQQRRTDSVLPDRLPGCLRTRRWATNSHKRNCNASKR